MALGIAESDFTANALADLGISVSREAVTKTISNRTGSPTYSYAAGSNITAVFTKRSQGFDWAKEGLFQNGDAIMHIDKDQSVSKDDLITFESEKFRIDTIILRKINGIQMMKTCNLFLSE